MEGTIGFAAMVVVVIVVITIIMIAITVDEKSDKEE
jgi:hypothetical protein